MENDHVILCVGWYDQELLFESHTYAGRRELFEGAKKPLIESLQLAIMVFIVLMKEFNEKYANSCGIMFFIPANTDTLIPKFIFFNGSFIPFNIQHPLHQRMLKQVETVKPVGESNNGEKIERRFNTARHGGSEAQH